MDSTNRETRLRLLEAAGEVFAEQGFHRATIRDICSRADANIAAVNYHFGDKERLYVAVIQHWLGEALRKYPPDGGLPPDAPAPGRLYAFVRSWLFRMLGEGMPAWHGKLMAREMSEPTAAFDVLLSETVRPMSQRLTAIVRELLRPNVDEQTVQDCAMSVAGQCCFRRHAHEMIRRLYPDQHYTSERIEQLARHVTDFSLAAIEAYSQRARS
ncbi:MAG TPA: CerR family C-terminal domain-containing protein [Tepidisphaeraceae bacterium]|jgi:AcrR family transcriptional regulator|nr:CerR family C-terminal domain-containing protein [Tepidisphaeraceae bacterium]